jgi:hypothetical protein
MVIMVVMVAGSLMFGIILQLILSKMRLLTLIREFKKIAQQTQHRVLLQQIKPLLINMLVQQTVKFRQLSTLGLL